MASSRKFLLVLAVLCVGALAQQLSDDFIVFNVEHNDSLSILVLEDATGVAVINGTSASAAGALDLLVFRNVASATRLRFIKAYDDGTYLTNAGLCSFGVKCSLGGFTFSATQYSPALKLSEHENQLVRFMMQLNIFDSPVHVDVGDSYAVSSPDGWSTIVFGGSDGPTFETSQLASVEVSVPPFVAINRMQLKNTDQQYPDMVAMLTFSDFTTYVDAECFHTELSGPLARPGLECEFSFSMSFDLSQLFSEFFFSASLVNAELAEEQNWDEQSTFTLFE